MNLEPNAFLRSLFDAAVSSAQPARVIKDFLPDKPQGRCVVVGAGKASAAMAAALEDAWPDVPMSGCVVTRYGHAAPTRRISILEAAHPVPDDNSLRAGEEIASAVRGLASDDLVIALISGGGSALMVAPAEGISLAEKQALNAALLKSGASISEMNLVRKHLSALKGGKLARMASPARVVTLVISDVPGDSPAVIASGPTVAEASSPREALDVLLHYGIGASPAVRKALESAASESLVATAPGDVRLIASPLMALKAAAARAAAAGITPLILGDAIEGEAREAGKVLASIAISAQLHARPVAAPCVLLSGGETTVTIAGGKAGRGGRNTEFLLASALALAGRQGIWALAGDTDGIDGTEDAAGALIGPGTLPQGQALGLEARQFLQTHDSYSYFDALGALVKTGPTLTNVNDFRAFLVLP